MLRAHLTIRSKGLDGSNEYLRNFTLKNIEELYSFNIDSSRIFLFDEGIIYPCPYIELSNRSIEFFDYSLRDFKELIRP